MINSNFNQQDYEIINCDSLYEGIFRLVRYHIRHRLFNGGWSAELKREVLQRMSAVAVLPYDPDLDQVVLIEQFRPGALGTSHQPWLIEIVAGVYDDEQPYEVAHREAIEEANCHLEALHPICDYFVSPGGSNEYLHIFCGKVDTRTIGGVHGLEAEHEDIRAFVLPSEEAFEAARSGKIKTSPAMIALQWLQINRPMLKALWAKR
jgi:ADP-ribose pyrophosphatase